MKFEISIVIATNRLPSKGLQIVANIINQVISFSIFEVILINDSKDDSPHFLPELLKKFGIHVIYSHTGGEKGVGYSRNLGISLSNSALIGFWDDDAIFDPLWIKHAVDLFSQNRDWAVICGRLSPTNPSHTLSRLRQMVYYTQMISSSYNNCDSSFVEINVPYAHGGNSAYRAHLFERFGNFDLEMIEDVELGYRLGKFVTIAFCARMHAYHEHSTDWISYYKRSFLLGASTRTFNFRYRDYNGSLKYLPKLRAGWIREFMSTAREGSRRASLSRLETAALYLQHIAHTLGVITLALQKNATTRK